MRAPLEVLVLGIAGFERDDRRDERVAELARDRFADELDRVLMLAARQVRPVLLGAPSEHQRGRLARLHGVAHFEVGQLLDPDAVARGDRAGQGGFLVVGLLRVGLALLGRHLPAPAARRRRLLRGDKGRKSSDHHQSNDNSAHHVLFLSGSRGPTPARRRSAPLLRRGLRGVSAGPARSPVAQRRSYVAGFAVSQRGLGPLAGRSAPLLRRGLRGVSRGLLTPQDL